MKPGKDIVMTLDRLAIGGVGRVENVTGDDDLSMRLMEMGLVPGTECRLVGMAPLGDPIEIELRGYRLSLRRSEGARIEISPLK